MTPCSIYPRFYRFLSPPRCRLAEEWRSPDHLFLVLSAPLFSPENLWIRTISPDLRFSFPFRLKGDIPVEIISDLQDTVYGDTIRPKLNIILISGDGIEFLKFKWLNNLIVKK